MSTKPVRAARVPTEELPEHTWTSEDLGALDDLISRVVEQPSSVEDLALEIELETAREELRVADEEIRVQRDQLEKMLALRRAGTVQRRRIASLLPVPMVTTDASGRIDAANAAAAALCNVPLVRLLGKPLQTFVHEGDRSAFRRALSDVSPDPARLRVLLAPRRSEPVQADVVLVAELDGQGSTEVLWSLLPVDGDLTGGRRMVDPLRLAAAVAHISRLPIGEADLLTLLGGFARVTGAAMSTSSSVSVNLGRPAEPTHIASTSEEAALADGLQVRTGEGPCVQAYDDQETVLVHDLRTDARWPRLRAALPGAPPGAAVVSVLAVPLVAAGRTVGAMNCYSTDPEAFDESEAQTAEVLALAAGAALEAVQETERLRGVAEQLDRALESRATIDQAKGIVMARRGCTADEAFAHLAALSQQRNVKLRDLARALVDQTAEASPGDGRRRPSTPAGVEDRR